MTEKQGFMTALYERLPILFILLMMVSPVQDLIAQAFLP